MKKHNSYSDSNNLEWLDPFSLGTSQAIAYHISAKITTKYWSFKSIIVLKEDPAMKSLMIAVKASAFPLSNNIDFKKPATLKVYIDIKNMVSITGCWHASLCSSKNSMTCVLCPSWCILLLTYWKEMWSAHDNLKGTEDREHLRQWHLCYHHENWTSLKTSRVKLPEILSTGVNQDRDATTKNISLVKEINLATATFLPTDKLIFEVE